MKLDSVLDAIYREVYYAHGCDDAHESGMAESPRPSFAEVCEEGAVGMRGSGMASGLEMLARVAIRLQRRLYKRRGDAGERRQTRRCEER